jgi:hypothetical protein
MSGTHEEDLVTKFFNDELSNEEQLRLAELLNSSLTDRARFAIYMQTEGELLRCASKRKLAASPTHDACDRAFDDEQNDALNNERRVTLNRPPRIPSRWLSGWWAGAASTIAVVVFLSFVMLQRSESQVSAADLFRQLEYVSNQRLDRVYKLERFVRRGETVTRVEGELRCRGTESFVAVFPGAFVGGGNGQYWCVTKSGLAFRVNSLSEVADRHAQLELGWLEALLSDSDSGLALSTAKVLSLIRTHGYEISREQGDFASDGAGDEGLVCHLPNQTRLPHTIRIRAERATQEIMSLDLDWGAGQRPRAADLLSIKLSSVGELPAEEFQMEHYLPIK